MDITNELDNYMGSELSSYDVVYPKSPKIFRDGLGNLHKFEPFEVCLIDSPIIQRLRFIHQTALTNLVYPSANHTRFEHSLGVASLVGRIAEALSQREETKETIDKNIAKTLRLAALLHDIGHGPFSHVTEEIISDLSYVRDEFQKGIFSIDKPHEMISYYMTKCNTFKNFLNDKILKKYKLAAINIDLIPNMIIGNMDNPDKYAYLGDIINGPFDADKLDYMMRDAHSTGIQMSYDLERYLYTSLIDIRECKRQRFIHDISGAHILEQLVFCKMFLFPSIYHHHKVRAVTCMLKSIFEKIYDYSIELNGKSFKKISDFLSYNDNKFFEDASKVEKLKTQTDNILKRKLLMRALVISRHTIEKESIDNFNKIVKLRMNNPNYKEIIVEIRKEIINKLKQKFGINLEYYDVWVDLPEFPHFSEPYRHIIKITDDEYTLLSALFPAAQWAFSFAEFKWKAHIFSPLKYQKQVSEISKEIFDEYFGIKFTKSATTLAKQHSDD